jgi:DNA polymerase
MVRGYLCLGNDAIHRRKIHESENWLDEGALIVRVESMSMGLKAITEELRRLQQEGVERVCVGEATLAQLSEIRLKTPVAPSARSETSSPDLIQLINDGKTPEQTRVVKPTRPAPKLLKPLPETPAQFELPPGSPESQMAWLKDYVENCTVCREHLSEDGKVVFGAGSAEADIFFCGEAPGADEETEGEPFVGKAGQLLTKILQAMGLQREQVYIANILKWRPEHDKPYGNRPPTVEEMNFCLPYLKAQIEIVKPKVIVALGNTAVTGLLGPDPSRRMGSIRGTWAEFAGRPLMITFHPSYLLRNNTLKTKRMVWVDLLLVMEKTGLPISEKQRGFFLPKN